MQDFNPNVRLEQYSEQFEIPVSNLAMLHRSIVSILSTDVKIRGLDLSHWNDDDNIDFVVLKANGIDFVILKVTEADYFVDDTFKTKYERALAAGIIVMPYHFFRGNYGGTGQAQHCVNTLRSLGFLAAINYVPVVWSDVETSDGVSVSTRRNRLKNFLDEIVIQSLQAGVYSSPSYWNTLIGAVTWINNFWQWAAHWTSASLPTLPINWTVEKALWWQNGIHPAHSWVETVIGASGNVDHNYFFGSLEDLKTVLKFEVTAPGECGCEEEISALYAELARVETEVNANKVEIYNLQQKDVLFESQIKDLYDIHQLVYDSTLDNEESIETLENRQTATESDVSELYGTTANLGIRIDELEALEAEIRAAYNSE
jgi:GH25 family lysozyme M1 (1,4-beta-N-acetylmuramidase)